MIAQSLLDFILALLRDPQAQQEFRDDPGGTLDRHGFHGLCAQDVADALPLVVDNSRVSLDRSFDVGNSNVSVHPVVPPPPSPHPMHGEHGMDAVVRQFDYITNTYTYTDSHNTILDNSVNQNIWAHGNVYQAFDNDPVINSGAASFGSGDAYNLGAVSANGAGSAVAVGDGGATGSADNNSTNAHITNFGAGEVAVAGDGSNATQTHVDSHNTTDSHNSNDSHNMTDSHNTTASNNTTASHNDVDTHVDSHNDINSNNDLNSHNEVDSHDHIDSHDDVLSHNDVGSHNDVDIASHNPVIIVP
jgi:hypothetical protein